DDALCQPTGSGMVDITQGQLTLVAGIVAAQAGGGRAANQIGPGMRTPVSEATIKASGTEGTTAYNQVGKTGTATTTVKSGMVEVTDSTTGTVVSVAAEGQNTVVGQAPDVFAAVLPSSRSVQVGTMATVFATIENGDQRKAAIACKI